MARVLVISRFTFHEMLHLVTSLKSTRLTLMRTSSTV